MARGSKAVAVLVMCANAAEARRIARSAVEKRLAACGNVFAPPVTSIYRWKGKIEQAREVCLLLKTTRKRFSSLQAEILRLHSYDVPEIIALPIELGEARYLKWVAENTSKASLR